MREVEWLSMQKRCALCVGEGGSKLRPRSRPIIRMMSLLLVGEIGDWIVDRGNASPCESWEQVEGHKLYQVTVETVIREWEAGTPSKILHLSEHRLWT